MNPDLRASTRTAFTFLMALAMGGLAAVAFSSQAHAQSTVSNLNDSGPGSLRQAIADVAPGGVIDFDVSGTIALESELVIDKDLTIEGNMPITVSGNESVRVFFISDGTVTLDRLTIADGLAVSDEDRDCDNRQCGGGIVIDNAGVDLTVKNSLITNNQTSQWGGGIANMAGNLTLVNTTVSSNTSRYPPAGLFNVGGGIRVLGGTTTLINSTITDNFAFNNGGGIAVGGSANLIVNGVIIAGNHIDSGSNDCNVSSTIATVSGSHNFLGVAGCEFPGSGDPLLEELADNGGMTRTHALLPGSPAIGGADNDICADSDTVDNGDQRGIPRPQGDACDIGAFESRGFTMNLVSGDGQATMVGTDFPHLLAVDVTSEFDEPVDGGEVTFIAPDSGASLSDEVSFASINDGLASLLPTANAVAGDYTVTAKVSGGDDDVGFGLTNLPQTFEVTASVASGMGEINPNVQSVVAGETASFSIEPETGWSVESVSGDTCSPTLVADNDWEAADIQDDCHVEASFRLNEVFRDRFEQLP